MNGTPQPRMTDSQVDAEVRRYLSIRAADVRALPTADDSIRVLSARLAHSPSAAGASHPPGRFHSMFSTVRLIAALAIVLSGVGAVFYSTAVSPAPVPLMPSPSASPSPDPAVATAFTGRILWGPSVRSGTDTKANGRVESRGNAWAPVVIKMSDPRLAGDATYSDSTDSYPGAADTTVEFSTGTWRIRTADGAWQGSNTGIECPACTVVLVGEGSYEGLFAVWEGTADDSGLDVHGAIFPAAPPAPPAPPIAP
jgi:hypothetical protein